MHNSMHMSTHAGLETDKHMNVQRHFGTRPLYCAILLLYTGHYSSATVTLYSSPRYAGSIHPHCMAVCPSTVPRHCTAAPYRGTVRQHHTAAPYGSTIPRHRTAVLCSGFCTTGTLRWHYTPAPWHQHSRLPCGAGVRIPPLPAGPLSVRDFQLLAWTDADGSSAPSSWRTVIGHRAAKGHHGRQSCL